MSNKVIGTDEMLRLLAEAQASLTAAVQNASGDATPTLAQVRDLIEEEGWTADDLEIKPEIDWSEVDFEQVAYEVGGEKLVEAAVANDGAADVLRVVLDDMDEEARAEALKPWMPSSPELDAKALIDRLGAEEAVRMLLRRAEVTTAHIARTIARFGGIWQRDIVARLKQETRLPDLFASDEHSDSKIAAYQHIDRALELVGSTEALALMIGRPAVTARHVGEALAQFNDEWQHDIVGEYRKATKVADLFATVDRDAIKAEVEREVREALIAKLFGAAQ